MKKALCLIRVWIQHQPTGRSIRHSLWQSWWTFSFGSTVILARFGSFVPSQRWIEFVRILIIKLRHTLASLFHSPHLPLLKIQGRFLPLWDELCPLFRQILHVRLFDINIPCFSFLLLHDDVRLAAKNTTHFDLSRFPYQSESMVLTDHHASHVTLALELAMMMSLTNMSWLSHDHDETHESWYAHLQVSRRWSSRRWVIVSCAHQQCYCQHSIWRVTRSVCKPLQ